MRVIARKTLVLFYRKHADAEVALEEWFDKTRKAQWDCFADIKRDFNSVDGIGDQHFVFNIKGNDYRLIAVVKFKAKIVYIRHIFTHSKYDKTPLK
jgi:mRNA interferase HigB